MGLAFLQSDQDDDQLVANYQRLVAVAGLALVGATWKMWTPQTVFPQVPFLGFVNALPAEIDWAGLLLLVVSLIVLLVRPGNQKIRQTACGLFVLSACWLIVADQHRFQPWLYQFLLATIVMAVVPAKRALPLVRLLVVGIYFHSAVSKFDFGFIDSEGHLFLTGLLHNFGLNFGNWPPAVVKFFVAAMPAGELLVAVLLCFSRTRPVAVWAAIIMHGTLMLALGPWGLNHKPGVLLWNVFFIVQVFLLFGSMKTRGEDNGDPEPPEMNWQVRFAQILVGLAVCLPFFESFGLWDTWPSWGLYATRQSQVKVYVHEDERGQLPTELKQHVSEPPFSGPWCRVQIDRWSLAAVNAPIYPQDRYQLGVAWKISEQLTDAENLRVIVEGQANRFTGQRTETELIGFVALQTEAARYWFNVQPR